jgi:prepilin-type N-terminal cleavage/methylation domain-containing protein
MKIRTLGFSLIELSIVLVIIGGIGLAAVKMFPQISELFDTATNNSSITTSSDALLGFVVANHRLPCPDTNNSGSENCASSAQTGNLPYKTLGLSHPVVNARGQSIHYAVRRSGSTQDLTKNEPSGYVPLLPNNEVLTHYNGLDFCYALQQSTMSAFSNAYPFIASMNMAFVLVDPGTENADGDLAGSLFDGINATSFGYELTTKQHDISYDDRVYGMAFTELAGRLQCAQQIAAVNGAAREAFAAADMVTVATFYVSYRAFAVEVNQANLDRRQFNQDTAIVMEAINVANIAISAAIAYNTVGISLAATVAPLALATTASTASLAIAIIKLTQAEESLAEANALKIAADVRLTELTTYASSTLTIASNIDAKGLF